MEKFTVIVETPAGSNQKYQYDETTNAFILKKVLPKGMQFPFDFGFLPATKGEDGDPLDVLIIAEHSTFSGCHVECRVIGAFHVEQTSPDDPNRIIRNDRFLAVPIASLVYGQIQSVGDLPSSMITQLSAFFKNYLEQEDKQLTVVQILQAQPAINLILKNNATTAKSLLYELFLPLKDGGGARVPSETFKILRERLVNKFGGVTIYQRSPATGIWDNNKKGSTADDLLVYEVMSSREIPEYWENLKIDLERSFDQQEVLIRKSPISIVRS